MEQYKEKLKIQNVFMMIGCLVLAVFAVLVLLWMCLVVFKMLMSGAATKPDKTNNLGEVPGAVMSPVAYAPTEAEIVAVIAAAIAMAESENNGMKFRVVSFKRKSVTERKIRNEKI